MKPAVCLMGFPYHYISWTAEWRKGERMFRVDGRDDIRTTAMSLVCIDQDRISWDLNSVYGYLAGTI
jgi:hypothetical protein